NGSANLYNVTIYGNTAKGSYKGALYLDSSSSTLNVYNSIVCNNSGGDLYRNAGSINAYNVLSSSTNWSNGLASVYAYDSSKPLFANAEEDVYSLAPGSQAIDCGNNEYVAEDVAIDLAGVPRIIGGTVDLGAYEYDPLTRLAAPTITSTTATENKIVVKWSAVDNASGYVVEYRKATETDADFTVMSATTATSRTIPNLDVYTTYYVRVYATSGNENFRNSPYSDVVSVTTKSETITLDAPTITATTPTETSIDVAWNPVDNASGYVVEYKLATAPESSYVTLESTTATSTTITGLAVDTTYDVRVYAAGDGARYADSPYGAVVSVTTLAPEPLSAPKFKTSSTTFDSITIAWLAVDNASGYVVAYRKASDGAYTEEPVTTETTYTIVGLDSETEYKVKVLAKGDGTSFSDSPYSAVKTLTTKAEPITLDAPTITATTTTETTIDVAWSPVTNASGYVVEYKLATAPDSSYVALASTTATSTTITGLVDDTTYNVRVYAAGNGARYVDSPYSAVVSVTTKLDTITLDAPTITATTPSETSIDVAWNPVTNASGYVVEYKLATAPDSSYVALASTTATSTTITGLVDDTTYNVRVYAAGNGARYVDSPYSPVTTVRTQAHATPEPASTVVTSLGDTVNAYDGVVTLREAITVYANAGDTITFDPALKGGVITLGGSQIEINKSLTIDASALWDATNNAPGVTIDANSTSRIFRVVAEVELDSLAFAGGASNGEGGGGAIYVFRSTLTVSNSTFQNNDAIGSGGGAICAFNSTLTISNSTFQNNAASTVYYCGGAIYVDDTSTLDATNVLIANNSASWGAGVFLVGSATLRNSTITNNSGSDVGGICLDDSAVLNVYNSIVAGNSGSWGDDVYKLDATTQTNAWNVLSSYASWDSGANQLTYNANQPLFADAAQGDYTLATGSQAINKGDVANVTTQTDLAGNTRIIGGTVDLGAYEYSAIPEPTPLDVPTWKSSSSTYNSVTVAWNPVTNASGYVVEYKGPNDTSYTVTPQTSDSTITITGLASETTYKLRVYAVGDGVNYSNSGYSAIKAVKTKTAPVPTPLTAPTITTTSATTNSITIKWNPVTNASGYVVEYKLATDPESSFASMPQTSDTTITIPNLAPVTSYNVRVYAKGDATNYSDSPYSAVKTVQTQAASADVPSTVVTSLADTVDANDGVITLREAITVYANDGDSVTFAPELKGGTIVLSGSQIVIDKAITVSARTLLDKTNGVPGITIDANSASRIFRITGDTVWIDSIAFTGGNGGGAGGAVYAYQSTLTISNSIFRANTGAYGGAVYADSSTLTISNVGFQNNTVEGEGGGAAINAYRSTLTISNASFQNNAAYYGGAIYSSYSMATISNASFQGNTASGLGGGAIGAQVSTLTISNASFQNNTAAYGGAFDLSSSALTLSNSTLTRNTALNASVFYLTSANVRVFNATIYGNSAFDSASNRTIFVSANSHLDLHNTIVAGNSGADVYKSDV
ncbi:MAG: fibronectin type III domain-containing protein, partial [Thermoguttaceae bacterium]|nr:fibronectin type III domain-containing protein [Thermoguttaceae bacterium]